MYFRMFCVSEYLMSSKVKTVEGILFAVVCWGSIAKVADSNALNKVIKTRGHEAELSRDPEKDFPKASQNSRKQPSIPSTGNLRATNKTEFDMRSLLPLAIGHC